MQEFEQDNVLRWSKETVAEWFEMSGFAGIKLSGFSLLFIYILENEIDGEVLADIDNESLADLGISCLGTRILILKAVYYLKKQYGIALNSHNFVPQIDCTKKVNFHTL
ncbi:Protein pob1 [Smittium culicis]|uniref:Protein pob1 n=1 Tax=Smittium culicis TaxID=133412 RepID=A0A1R1YT47_9FUNG|nr:Protein pob1 [Smittium culicis]